MTDYVVLRKLEDDAWGDKSLAPAARSARSAIQAVVDHNEGLAGEYVAIPLRSWKPVTVKVETKTALKFS